MEIPINDNCNTIISAIKKIIEQYKKNIASAQKEGLEIEKYKSYLIKIVNDINNITIEDSDFANRMIDYIFAQSSLSQQELDDKKGIFDSLHFMISQNQNEGTTHPVTKKQYQLIQELGEILSKLSIDLINASRKITYFDKLLKKINDENNEEFISADELRTIFSEIELQESEKEAIIAESFEYNKNIFAKKSKKTIQEKKSLDREEVEKLFSKYGYAFSKEIAEKNQKGNKVRYLKESFQTVILENGNLEHMDEIFKTLEELNMPKMLLPEQSKLLANILIYGDREVLKNVVEKTIRLLNNADIKNNEKICRNLLNFGARLLPQAKKGTKANNNGGSRKNPPPDKPKQKTDKITGHHKDFLNNIEFLATVSQKLLNVIYEQCPCVLDINHKRLKRNLTLYFRYFYGINIESANDLEEARAIIEKAPPGAFRFLETQKFIEVIDQFIATGLNGYMYVKQNLSALNNFRRPDHVVFYNIYNETKKRKLNDEKNASEGPYKRHTRDDGTVVFTLPMRIQTEYNGMDDQNKKELTETIDIKTKNYDEFMEAVEESKENDDTSEVINEDIEVLAQKVEQRFPWLKKLRVEDKNHYFAYSFSKKYISRYQVARIYSILMEKGLDKKEDALLFAITYNGIMDEEQFSTIKNKIEAEKQLEEIDRDFESQEKTDEENGKEDGRGKK